MKKVLASGLLAICVIALGQQQASAWINAKFGVGLNWNFQSGGNTWGWGAWRNGQPPGPEALNSGPYQPYGPVFPNYPPPQYAPPMMDHGYHGQLAPQFAPEMPQYAQPAPQYAQPTPQYAQPTPQFGAPFQFANNPRSPR
jgi:hypothetical protein